MLVSGVIVIVIQVVACVCCHCHCECEDGGESGSGDGTHPLLPCVHAMVVAAALISTGIIIVNVRWWQGW